MLSRLCDLQLISIDPAVDRTILHADRQAGPVETHALSFLGKQDNLTNQLTIPIYPKYP